MKKVKLKTVKDFKNSPTFHSEVKKMKGEWKLTCITGYKNYTPEVIAKLKELGYNVIKDVVKVTWLTEAGKYHRENGPAIEWAIGDKFWYLNGKLHREDGPACEFVDGIRYRYWYLNNDKYELVVEPKTVMIAGKKFVKMEF